MSGDVYTALRHGAREGSQLHWHRTLVAKGPRPLTEEHLQWKPESQGLPALHCLLVDCSQSMLAGGGLARAKGLLLRLIQMSYEQRAEVAIVGFSGAAAKVHLAPTLARPMTSRHVEKWLQPIRGAGATPFARGVAAASNLLMRAARERPQQTRWLWLLTDGRTLEAPTRPRAVDTVVIVDCDQRRMRVGQCRTLARRWHADYRDLAEFTPTSPQEQRT
jgi:magnesium chelatase subunit ChlD-like protein